MNKLELHCLAEVQPDKVLIVCAQCYYGHSKILTIIEWNTILHYTKYNICNICNDYAAYMRKCKIIKY